MSSNVQRTDEPERRPTLRWVRLCIFVGVALIAAILSAIVFLENHPDAADMTEKLTSVFLSIGLAAWGLSEAAFGRWLTIKKTFVVAVALFGIAFLSIAIFLGKPLAGKMEELGKEQSQLDRRFAESITGKILLQPESFASPEVAANSLFEFQQYADATEQVNKRKEALLLERDDPSVHDRWVAYFEATRDVVSKTKELYRFAAEPSRKVHVENRVVVIADSEGYNKRIDSVNQAAAKLRLTTEALGSKADDARRK
jgi:hypothetical protein